MKKLFINDEDTHIEVVDSKDAFYGIAQDMFETLDIKSSTEDDETVRVIIEIKHAKEELCVSEEQIKDYLMQFGTDQFNEFDLMLSRNLIDMACYSLVTFGDIEKDPENLIVSEVIVRARNYGYKTNNRIELFANTTKLINPDTNEFAYVDSNETHIIPDLLDYGYRIA